MHPDLATGAHVATSRVYAAQGRAWRLPGSKVPGGKAKLRGLDVELEFLDHQMIGERHRLRAPAPQEQRRHLPEPPQPRAPEPSRPFIGRGLRPPCVTGLVLVAKPSTSSTVSPAGFGIDAPAPVTVAVGGIGLVGTAPPAPAGHSIRIAPRLDRLAQVPTAQGSLESLVKPMRRPSAPFDAAPHGAGNANANARPLARIPAHGAGSPDVWFFRSALAYVRACGMSGGLRTATDAGCAPVRPSRRGGRGCWRVCRT